MNRYEMKRSTFCDGGFYGTVSLMVNALITIFTQALNRFVSRHKFTG